MKKLFLFLGVVLPCFIFTACSKEYGGIIDSSDTGQGVGDNTEDITITGDVATLYVTGAEIVGYLNVSNAEQAGVVYSIKSGVNIYDKVGYQNTKNLKKQEYKVTISELKADTKYYYRSFARIGGRYVYGEEKSFTTKGVKASAMLTNQDGRIATFTCTTTLEDFDLQSKRNVCGFVLGTSADVNVSQFIWFSSAHEIKNGSYSTSVDDLKTSTKYYYRAYTYAGDELTYSDVQSFTTAAAKIGNAIDLGLSVKWADLNVGAISPEDYGDYFAWGETEPKEKYNSDNYKHCGESLHHLKKYCTHTTFGIVDNKTILDLYDDAAHVKWGSDWRMPTSSEFGELCTKCIWTWTTQAGSNGFKVTGPNGNSIFLPAAGERYDSDPIKAGSEGNYWASSLASPPGGLSPDRARGLNFFKEHHVDFSNGFWRTNGYSVRPVCK